jgi:hypothetical protein
MSSSLPGITGGYDLFVCDDKAPRLILIGVPTAFPPPPPWRAESVSASSSVGHVDGDHVWDLAELEEGCEVEDRPSPGHPTAADPHVEVSGSHVHAHRLPTPTPRAPASLVGGPRPAAVDTVREDSTPLSPTKPESAATLTGVTHGLRAAALQ